MIECQCGKVYYPAQAWIHANCKPKPMANKVETMANTPRPTMANTYTYRYRDKGKRQEYMREYMAKRRTG